MISLRLPLVSFVLAVATASAGTIYSVNLPTASPSFTINGSATATTPPYRADVGVEYGVATSLVNGSTEPFILGDQFTTSGETEITSVTIYEISNTAVNSGGGSAGLSNPANEFSSLSLYIGPDSTSLGSPVDTLSGASLSAASVNTLNTDGSHYQSISSTSRYYIWAVTFSGLDVTLSSAGLYDFAIGADPNPGNTFALLMSDPNAQSSSGTGQVNNGFIELLPDGTGGSPLAEYQYGPGGVGGFSDPDPAIDVVGNIQGQVIPEPSSLGLIGLGLGGVLVGLSRRISPLARAQR